MLSSIKKGLLVGLANLGAVGLVFAGREEPRHLFTILFFVTFIGGLPALFVGGLCGWIADRLPVFRRLVLIAISFVAVIVLGMLTEPPLIGPAMVPTMIAALVLEYWTRPNLAVHEPKPSVLSPTVQGMLLGLGNVLAVALLLAIYVTRIEPRHIVGGITIQPPFGLHFAVAVICVGAIPGMVVGGLSGFLAERLRDHHLVVRLAGIGSIAVTGVFALASLTDTPMLVMPALMPTLFATAVLERISRTPETVPAARVHRHA